PIYKLAKSKGMKTKVHIGEFSNHNTIEEAIDILNPIEIQHGIRSVDSKNTLRKIVDHNIRLNVCPQSNIALGASDNYESHPIRVLFEEGIKFSINTDDFLLFDASISNQYVSLVQHRVFTLEEIKSINDDALTNSLKSINKTV
ncbi:MAG: adenosine deaminase, partial [Bacteroidota bacterium]